MTTGIDIHPRRIDRLQALREPVRIGMIVSGAHGNLIAHRARREEKPSLFAELCRTDSLQLPDGWIIATSVVT